MKPPIRSVLTAVLLFGFLLGIRNGQIALWKDNDPQPLRVFSWRAMLLPQQIQDALTKGIHIEEDSDIGQLIRDMIA